MLLQYIYVYDTNNIILDTINNTSAYSVYARYTDTHYTDTSLYRHPLYRHLLYSHYTDRN